MEPYVFISYSSQNYAQAQGIRNHLERSGLRCWMAPDNIEGGKSYASQIPQAINNCGAFVLVLDRAAMASQWVSREVDRAINQKKRIFPFMTEYVSLTDEFAFYLNNAQYYTAFQNYGRALDQMTRELAAHLQVFGTRSPINPTVPFPTPTPNNSKKKKGLLIGMLAAGAALLAAVVLLIVLDPFGFRKSPTAWKNNVLMSDVQKYSSSTVSIQEEEAGHFMVFESDKYKRSQIKRIYFLDTLADMPTDAWDVSGENRVMAWVTPDGELYNLYLAGECGICAPEDCSYLFAGYNNVISISFGGCFHTDNVRLMYHMFAFCSKLKRLNLSELNTNQVQDMRAMFINDRALEKVTLDGVQTDKLELTRAMFYGCQALTELNFSSFNTSNVTDMALMFYNCQKLYTITFGDHFTTKQVQYMNSMFQECKALKDLDLRNYNTESAVDMKKMFYNCTNLKSIQYGAYFKLPDTEITKMYDGCINLKPEYMLIK